MDRKGFAPAILILVVAGILVVGAGAWFFLKQSPQKPESQNPPAVVPVSAPNTSLETQNWKSFTDPQGNYTFKYPSDWVINNTVNGAARLRNYTHDGNPEENEILIIIIPLGIQPSSLSDYVKNIGFDTTTPVKINGYDALQINDHDLNAVKVYIGASNKIYSVTYLPLGANQNETFNKILSTLHFN